MEEASGPKEFLFDFGFDSFHVQTDVFFLEEFRGVALEVFAAFFQEGLLEEFLVELQLAFLFVALNLEGEILDHRYTRNFKLMC